MKALSRLALLALVACIGCGSGPDIVGEDVTIESRTKPIDSSTVEDGDDDGQIPWGEDVAAVEVPAVFKKASAVERLAAEEAARQDAYRKLIERVYGLQVDASTDVYDLAAASRTVAASIEGQLSGMQEAGIRRYADGRVEAAMRVTVQEVVVSIARSYKLVKKGDRIVAEEAISNIERSNRDKYLVVVGRGALKGSEGHGKVKAMRAAEADCYARIAERVCGLQVFGNTTVRDAVLRSDAVRSKVSVALLGGVKFQDYRFAKNGSCEVVGLLTIRQVVDVLTRTVRRYAKGGEVKWVEDIQAFERKNRDLVITAVGRGAALEAQPEPVAKPLEEKKIIIERVIGTRIIVD